MVAATCCTVTIQLHQLVAKGELSMYIQDNLCDSTDGDCSIGRDDVQQEMKYDIIVYYFKQQRNLRSGAIMVAY